MTRFSLGRVIATPGAFERIDNETMWAALDRHSHGDWGELCDEDRANNENALKVGARLMSVYSKDDEVFWVITEADRSSTTVLLPDEY